MSEQIPQWLISTIAEALRDVGATAPKSELKNEAERLVKAWGAPERPAHNIRYLSTLLERLADFDAVAADPAALKLAAAYLVTTPETVWESIAGVRAGRRIASEPVRDRLGRLGLASADAERIQALVKELHSGSAANQDLEVQILFDALLETMGSNPQRYAKYRENLRAELPGLSDTEFLRARKRFILEVLGRNRIFLTPFATAWTEPVRDNLLGELSVIDARLGEETSIPRTRTGGRNSREPDTQTGPLLIRHGPVRETQKRAEPEAPESSAAPIQEQKRAVEESTHEEETSTLESFEDPFSHRRRRSGHR